MKRLPIPALCALFSVFVCYAVHARPVSLPFNKLSHFTGYSAVPYNLTEFLASYTRHAVVLNWTTTFDNNKDRFEIERSTDGVVFKHAGTVKAQGSFETPHIYAFSDEAGRKNAAASDLYYRLKQVDLNGNAMYSKVLIVRVYKTRTLQMVSATPNPVLNDINVNVHLKENAFMVTKVVNAAGVEVLRKSGRGGIGDNNVILEGTSRLAQGIYYLEVIINSNERMMIKLIKE